jgi:hypothetical protein
MVQNFFFFSFSACMSGWSVFDVVKHWLSFQVYTLSNINLRRYLQILVKFKKKAHKFTPIYY